MGAWCRSGAILLFLLLVGCAKPRQAAPAGSIAILVDRTASVSKQLTSIYPKYFQTYVARSFVPGERVLIESITDESTLSNPPMRIVDTKLPTVTPPTWRWWADDYAVYRDRCHLKVSRESEQYISEARRLTASTTAVFRPADLSRFTYIIDGIEDASDFLKHTPPPHRLVLFTDGIEDSDENGLRLKFDLPDFWRTHTPLGIVSSLRRQQRIPDLQGSHVYLIGAATRTPEEFHQDQRFWREFFLASGVAERDIHIDRPAWEEDMEFSDQATALKYFCGDDGQ